MEDATAAIFEDKKQSYYNFRKTVIEETIINDSEHEPFKQLDFSKLRELRAKALNLDWH